MRKWNLLVWILLAGCMLTLISCDEEDNGTPPRGDLTVKLTSSSKGSSLSLTKDLTYPIEAVYVEIDHVEMHYSDENIDNVGWVYLLSNRGIYDLTKLDPGSMALLVDKVNMPFGTVTDLRIAFGANSSVVRGGKAYPLQVPAVTAPESLIPLKDDHTLKYQYIEIVIDIHPYHSITTTNDETYIFEPVIHKVEVFYQ